MTEPGQIPAENASPTGKFAEQRAKWDRWIEERTSAQTLREPLYIFVDDEIEQLSNRYYEARRLKVPGRNILMFRNAESAIEFHKYASEKGLHIAATIADYDNGKVSPATGIDIMQAVSDYDKDQDHTTTKIVISSGNRESQVTEFNKQIFDGLEAPSSEAEAQGVFAAAAKRKAIFVHKDDLFELGALLPSVPENQREGLDVESTTLIPDLIYSLEVMNALTKRFRNVLEPYENLQVDPNKPDSSTLKQVYHDVTHVLRDSARRMENMVKIWVMLKDYEFKVEQKSGKHSPNTFSEEPEEPLNVRILGTFFLHELKTIQENMKQCEASCDLFRFTAVREAIQKDTTIDVSAYKTDDTSMEEARLLFSSHLGHNLQNPFGNIRNTITALVGSSNVEGVLPKFLKASHSTVLWEAPKEGETRFDHNDLLDMGMKYLADLKNLEPGQIPPPIFYYTVASKSSPRPGEGHDHATRDRTENTPDEPAPTRKTINIPRSDVERDQVIAQIKAETKQKAMPISRAMILRFMAVVEKDMEISQQVSAVGKGEPRQSFSALAEMLMYEMEKMRKDDGWGRTGNIKRQRAYRQKEQREGESQDGAVPSPS